MKKLHQYTMILLAGVLGACSSMSVDDPYVDSFPADFNSEVYMQLHPELRMMQIRETVSDYNEQYRTNSGLKLADYNKLKAAEDAVFVTNLEVLKAIYLDPYMGGGTEAGWETFSADATKLQSLADGYNYVGVDNDLALLTAIPVDYMGISQHFNMYGRIHGWAYRYCLPTELGTPRSELPIASQQLEGVQYAEDFVPDYNLYCRDANGVDRLIQ
jgi:hypothetical protein